MDSTTSVPNWLQISGGGIDIADVKDGIINIDLTIKRELKEELNLNLDDIDYKIEFIECPSKTRNAYGFLAIGKINQTKEELAKYFEEYKEYLIQNNLETEFNRLIFLKKENALKEFDKLPNGKRPYLRALIEEAVGEYE
jgi:8-oxo-dGTP pyrophosphatase MutT (NUDIX family)